MLRSTRQTSSEIQPREKPARVDHRRSVFDSRGREARRKTSTKKRQGGRHPTPHTPLSSPVQITAAFLSSLLLYCSCCMPGPYFSGAPSGVTAALTASGQASTADRTAEYPSPKNWAPFRPNEDRVFRCLRKHGSASRSGARLLRFQFIGREGTREVVCARVEWGCLSARARSFSRDPRRSLPSNSSISKIATACFTCVISTRPPRLIRDRRRPPARP